MINRKIEEKEREKERKKRNREERRYGKGQFKSCLFLVCIYSIRQKDGIKMARQDGLG